jgi:hypothetical protein
VTELRCWTGLVHPSGVGAAEALEKVADDEFPQLILDGEVIAADG